MASHQVGDEEIVVQKDEVRSFVVRCMKKFGAVDAHAAQLADVLVAADYRGHYSHGLNRLETYIHELKSGLYLREGEPEILKERPATAWVDGKSLLGPVVGNFCMDLAIKKAKQVGVGWVAAKGANHFGIAGWYSIRAAEKGLIIAVGTNPISLAAPGDNGDQFVLDMATTTVALGKVEMAERKGLDIPKGWAAGSNGEETTDPKACLAGGGLLPLAGSEISGGYKGYGLAAMVEILCGVSADATWGSHVRHWKDATNTGNLDQCFIAVDPQSFAPGFEGRTQEFMDELRSLEPVDPEKPVLVAGDPERRHMAKCDRLGGIPYHLNQIKHASDIAAEVGVRPMKTKMDS